MSDTSDTISAMQGLSNSLNTLNNNVTSADFHSLKNFKKWTQAQNDLNYDYQTKIGDYNNKQMRDNTLWSLSTGKAAEIAGLKAAGLNPAMMGDSAAMVSMSPSGENGSPGKSPYDPSSRQFGSPDFMTALMQGQQIKQMQANEDLIASQSKLNAANAESINIDTQHKQTADSTLQSVYGVIDKGQLDVFKEMRDYVRDTAVARSQISESELKEKVTTMQKDNPELFNALANKPANEQRQILAFVSMMSAQTRKLLTDEKFVKEQIESEYYKQNKMAGELKLLGATYEETLANIDKLSEEQKTFVQNRLIQAENQRVSRNRYLDKLTGDRLNAYHAYAISTELARSTVDVVNPLK